ncbi:Spy/CpxP family protein refolding chaperone [Telmatospirillum siberiense]|uniref:LTXXQ motif family protein n=1 Tax=Telmatospirillum siberiense TaxID=382514 RepID=A0A2N3PYA5_9PROT|nr:Spy/CpxP family protein refolding chaperone [Telmatospirillum siberiense]PKU25387.1 hypothetical protein CWS72_07295 [Telmatospirillum siberiense]
MSIRKTFLLTAFPLLWATMACAQGVPPSPPPAGQPPAPTSEMRHSEEDPVARHKNFCDEHHAHEIARLAYLEAKLDLTEKQRAAWNKWRQVQIDNAGKEQADCLSNVPTRETKPTALEREAQMEKGLAVKLQNLQSSRPALEALYEVLTPAQRTVFDRPPHGDHFAPPHGVPFGQPGPLPPQP